MKTKEVNENLIGKRVAGVFTAMEVTGTIIGIVREKSLTRDEICSVGVEIKLDEPVRWGDYIYTKYCSTARVSDDWGNLSLTKVIN